MSFLSFLKSIFTLPKVDIPRGKYVVFTRMSEESTAKRRFSKDPIPDGDYSAKYIGKRETWVLKPGERFILTITDAGFGALTVFVHTTYYASGESLSYKSLKDFYADWFYLRPKTGKKA